jgi:hypothetical protein
MWSKHAGRPSGESRACPHSATATSNTSKRPLYKETHHQTEHHCSSPSQVQLGCCDKPLRGSLTARQHAASHLPARPFGRFHQLHLCDSSHLQAYAQREGMLLLTCRQKGLKGGILLRCPERWILRQWATPSTNSTRSIGANGLYS